MLEAEGTNGRSLHINACANSLECNEESVREANRPRSRCAELCVALLIAACTHAVTIWILVAIVVPLFVHNFLWAYNILLAILGTFALGVSFYVFQIGWGSFQWTRKYRALKDTDWHREWLKKFNQGRRGGEVLEWSSVHHYVVVTNYKEPIDMLKLLAYSLMSQKSGNFCGDHITLVFAMEEREGAEVDQKVDTLLTELGPFFYEVLATFHPPDLLGDIKGKASNYKWAVKEVEAHIRAAATLGGHAEEFCLIHVADADSLYDPNYFPNVTYHFCVDPDRYHLVWQPCMIPTCNFWDLAAPCRQVNTMIAAQEMMSAYDKLEFQIPFSTYGLALKTLQLVGGTGDAADAQDGDVIAEDHHLFIKGFFATDTRLRVHPIFLPCLNFAVGGETQPWCSNIRDRFIQAKRHMFGISEFIYYVVILFRGRWCRRRRFGCKEWIRTVNLFWKLLKIHSIPYLGMWVGLGVALVSILKLQKEYCDHVQDLKPGPASSVCDRALTGTTETIGALLFSVTTTLTFIGSFLLIVSFVRMLHATHHTLTNIGDPNGSFMDSSIWDRNVPEEPVPSDARQMGSKPREALRPVDSSCLLESDRRDGVEALAAMCEPVCRSCNTALASNARFCSACGRQVSLTSSFEGPGSFARSPLQMIQRQRPSRRPMHVGGGVPWLGTMLQMVVEFIVLGFITSMLFGSIPAIIALYKLIFQGHRMEYVTAPKPGTGAPTVDTGLSAATTTAGSSMSTRSFGENTPQARGPKPLRSSRRQC